MENKDLISRLQQFDGDSEVVIYNNATGTPLWIPDYDMFLNVATDDDFANEFDYPKGTVFIHGK